MSKNSPKQSNRCHSPKSKTIRENGMLKITSKNIALPTDLNSCESKQISKKKWHPALNYNNSFISKKEVQLILKKGGISDEINDLSIWQRAFVHKSYVKNTEIPETFKNSENMIPLQDNSNERLEWLGDANLQCSVSYYLWERYPKQDEGFLTKLRSKLVKTKNLAFLSKKLGLSPHLLVSHHVEFGCQGRNNAKILENTFESFIGAMFVDFTNKVGQAHRYEIVRKFIITIVEKYVDMVEMVMTDENSKDQLMWYFQKNFNGAYPIYMKEKHENECFYIYILEPDSDKVIGKGSARSKKQAEQNAAKNAISYYAKKDFLHS